MSSQRLARTMINANVQNIQIKRVAANQISSTNLAPDSPNVSTGSLSPAIQTDLNNFKDFISKSNLINNNSESLINNNNNLTPSTIKLNDSNGIDRKFLKVGNYILFETQSIDMYNTAYNISNSTYYYWKKIPKSNYIKKLEAYFLMEGNEQIYRFSELIKCENDVYVFFEQHYGDLHSYMKEKKRLKESEAKRIFYQICKVVLACHENGIIVRDIKLKKFVFANEEKTKILIANLEDCLVLNDSSNDLIKSQQGCPAYVSPEVLNQQIPNYSGRLSDTWSLGIVLYTLLFGRYPFHHNQITAMFAKITKGKFQVPTNGITLNAKTLIRALIRLNPTERLNSNEILSHRWFDDVELNDYCHFNLFKQHQSSQDINESINYFSNEFFNQTSSSVASNLNSRTVVSHCDINEQSVPIFNDSM